MGNKTIIATILIGLILLTGCEPCKETYETTTVTDLISINTALLTQDRCIVNTEQGKVSLEGYSNCKVQIGDTIQRRTDECELITSWQRK